ncbi:response regulator [Pseudanabaena sp. PCC 6802]|uniref:response regulator n=1 Tax=Pseudanabaena sp. PCC 6802 TaxID=118173 RepID=UPI00034B8871|nr:response regulator [Pseudanabaena sp. PCC 6802]
MKILLVEDDEATVNLLQLAFSRQQYTIDVALDGNTGWQFAESKDYDLILLDVMLPKLDGISFCRRLRSQQKYVPVLMMTARDAVSDRVLGLDAGADDYLVKPFELSELAARVRSLLRRGKDTAVSKLTWGDIHIDTVRGEAYYRDSPLQLSRKEYAILELFLRHPKQIFAPPKIIDLLWSLDSTPGDETVKAHIKGLRRKLKKLGAPPDAIETVYAQGYRLNPALLAETTTTQSSYAKPKGERKTDVDLPESAEQRMMAKVAQIWQANRLNSVAYVTLLEQSANSLALGNFANEQVQEAAQVAHKLAGSLGMFGFQDGSGLAKQIEQLLQTPDSLDRQQIEQISNFVSEIRHVIETAAVPNAPSPPPQAQPLEEEQRPLLLVVDSDREFAQRLAAEAVARGYRSEIVSTPNAGREWIAREPPVCVITELCFPGESEQPGQVWQFLRELQSAPFDIPTVTLTANDSFSDRLEAARCGSRIFLQKTSALSAIVESVTQLLNRDSSSTVRVLAVDDDPQILELLHSLLEPHGIQVISLNDPSRFWPVFEETVPDMIILDIKMSDINGIELCQIIRSDPTWHLMPIIFLTAHTDEPTIQSLFAAGADDWIAKPATTSMLVTRIFNRLERIHRLRLQAEVDPLTGVSNRRKSGEEVKRLIGLAKRYEQPFCLGVLDLDKLKLMNERYGKNCGDRVLHTIGNLLPRQFRNEDVVACWGGGEFIVGMYGITKADSVERLAETLENIRQIEFCDPKGHRFNVTLSAGVAQYLVDGADLDMLYKSASGALYQAKSTGRDRVLPVGWQPPHPEHQFTTDVVLVSDETIIPYQLIRDLGRRGFHAHWRSDYHGAVDNLCDASLRPRVIILGAAPPDLSHLELLKRLKRKKVLQPIRVILLSDDSSEAQQAMGLGAFDYVVRPWTVSVLLQRLRRALKP